MAKLSVNVNKIATLRNTRTLGIPSIVQFSQIALDAGAHGITIHPRPDQRHIRPGDVADLAALLKKYPHAEFNIEGNPLIEFMHFIEAHRPTQCTLVPDAREAFTSNHGWELNSNKERLGPLIKQLKQWGCRVSLFMDPNPEQMQLACDLGADRIELYTEPYALAFAAHDAKAADSYRRTADRARELGLGVNAGHDLNLQNLPPLLAQIPYISEVSIGHALIADALQFGMAETVRKYLHASAAT